MKDKIGSSPGIRRRSLAITLLLVAAGSEAFAQPRTPRPNTGMADAATFEHHFRNWRRQAGDRAGRILDLVLTPLPGLTDSAGNASAQVELDLSSGRVAAQLRGAPGGETWAKRKTPFAC